MASNVFQLDFIDNSAQITQKFDNFCYAALEKIGIAAEGYAVQNAPVGTPESTGIQYYHGGSLKESLTHKVVGAEVYVGTNLTAKVTNKDGSVEEVPYPIYVEHGTGVYADNGKGRQSPWVWRDKNGDYHWTRGIKPQHFLLKAITEHDDEYKNILKNSFQF